MTARDATNPLIERLDPERLCTRITDVAQAAGVSRPQTMLAVLALIDRIVVSEKGPDAEAIARLWAQYLDESWLSKA